MKRYLQQDLNQGLNLFIAVITNILILYICYPYFTRHIVHTAPNTFFIILNSISIYLAFKTSTYKLFIPVKIIFIMMFAFSIAALSVWVLRINEYPYFFEVRELFFILLLPLGGFIWMKLYVVIPIITVIYIAIIFYLKGKIA